MELDWFTESFVFYLILISISLDFLRKVLVDSRYEDLPAELKTFYSPASYEQARNYEYSYNKYEVCMSINNFAKNASYFLFPYYLAMWHCSKLLLSATRAWPSNWDEEIGTTFVYHTLTIVIENLTILPFKYYEKFVIEDANGFNRSSTKIFFQKSAKNLMIYLLIYSSSATFTVLIAKHSGTYFYIFIWLQLLIGDISLSYIFPWLIDPISNKYSHLREGALKSRLERLAQQVNFPVSEILLCTSKSSSHTNAYLDGTLTSKRIVLMTNLDNVTDENVGNDSTVHEEIEELAAVVAHELGHWNGLHQIKEFIYDRLRITFLVAIFVLLYRHGPIFQVFGFRKGEMPIWVAVDIIKDNILITFYLITNILESLLSRTLERQADNYAVKLGLGGPLKKVLCRCSVENLSFPIDDPLSQFCEGDHPTLPERILNIDNEMKKYE